MFAERNHRQVDRKGNADVTAKTKGEWMNEPETSAQVEGREVEL